MIANGMQLFLKCIEDKYEPYILSNVDAFSFSTHIEDVTFYVSSIGLDFREIGFKKRLLNGGSREAHQCRNINFGINPILDPNER